MRAGNSNGESDYSKADSGYRGNGSQSQQSGPAIKLLNPPTSVAASDGSYTNMVRITWDASNGATGYKVYRATSQGGNYAYIGQTDSTYYEDYVNDTGAYWYRVRAIFAFGGSGYSNADRGYRR